MVAARQMAIVAALAAVMAGGQSSPPQLRSASAE
jgi:hypothetical protein